MNVTPSNMALPGKKPPARVASLWRFGPYPFALAHARVVERLAPQAWLINFTNPAGLITQALNQHTNLRIIGICDTPAELFHRIAQALGEPISETLCQYAGLNHLGWVRRVTVGGKDRHRATTGKSRVATTVVSCEFIRSATDPNAAADSIRIFVFLLQPAKSVSQPSYGPAPAAAKN